MDAQVVSLRLHSHEGTAVFIWFLPICLPNLKTYRIFMHILYLTHWLNFVAKVLLLLSLWVCVGGMMWDVRGSDGLQRIQRPEPHVAPPCRLHI